jgi:voltage-gated potassium channel
VITITLTGIDTVPHGVGGEIATILLILSGVAIYGYLATVLVEVITRGVVSHVWADRRRQKKIDRLSDHFIICGYGRVGRSVAADFRKRGQPYVVVDHSDDTLAAARDAGELLVEESRTQDENLEAAGLQRTKGLIVASDAPREAVAG